MVKRHINLSMFPDDTYVSMAEMGNCRVCGEHDDLRMGACYTCADFVDGKEVPGGHELWDKRNPENRWTVRVQ